MCVSGAEHDDLQPEVAHHAETATAQGTRSASESSTQADATAGYGKRGAASRSEQKADATAGDGKRGAASRSEQKADATAPDDAMLTEVPEVGMKAGRAPAWVPQSTPGCRVVSEAMRRQAASRAGDGKSGAASRSEQNFQGVASPAHDASARTS